MRKSFKDSLKALEANIHFTNTLKGFQFQTALHKCNVAGKPAVVTRGLYPVETISTVGKICAEDYLAAPSTTNQSYIVILEHTIAERERSLHQSQQLPILLLLVSI